MSSAQQLETYITRADDRDRERLIQEFAPLVRHVVDRLPVLAPTVSKDDLVSQGILGLLEAVERYDPDRGVKFETFAYYRIRGAIMDMIRELDMLPRSLREKQSRLKDTHRGLVSELGRTPTDEELADALELPIDDLHTLLYELDFEQVLSLDHKVPRDEGVFASLGDVLPADPSSAPDTLAIDAEDRRRLAAAIDDLPPVNRQVISLYYHEGLTLKEIGLVLGVSEARVCQIHRKTVGMLKATLASQETLPCP